MSIKSIGERLSDRIELLSGIGIGVIAGSLVGAGEMSQALTNAQIMIASAVAAIILGGLLGAIHFYRNPEDMGDIE